MIYVVCIICVVIGFVMGVATTLYRVNSVILNITDYTNKSYSYYDYLRDNPGPEDIPGL